MKSKISLAACALGLVAISCGSTAFAQTSAAYPARPIKIIVPYPAGGPIDTIGRLLAQTLPSTLGGQAFVENVVGAGGVIGMRAAAAAPADGLTIVVANENLVIQPLLQSAAQFDAIASFEPVMLVASAPMTVAVHPSLPAKTWAEFDAVLKRDRGKYGYASPGYGTSPHLASEKLFNMTLGHDVRHVPFQGAAGAVQAVLAGEPPIFQEVLPAVTPHVRQGALRALAVAAAKRSPSLPDVPTLAEVGVSGHEASFWSGVLLPTGVPSEILEALRRAIEKAVVSEAVRGRLETMGFDVIASQPQSFAAHISSEKERYARIIRESRIKLD